MTFSDRDINLILAPGRTGTVFLARALASRFDSIHCVHEPSFSRAVLMIGNFRNLTGLGSSVVRRLFRACLAKRLGSLSLEKRYVEVNPMLCPVTDLLAELDAKINLVHLVREPLSWARSIRSFRASGHFRHVIDYIPFATPFPTPRPQGWSSLSATERALWRWRFCNDRILDLAKASSRYEFVRYEDLFAVDPKTRETVLAGILDCLGIEDSANAARSHLDWFPTDTVINPAPASSVDASADRAEDVHTIDPKTLQTICGPLLARFGYA